MKIFDFFCPKCKKVEERFVMHDGDTEVCSVCGGEMVKQISAPGMVVTNCADKPGFKKRK